MKPALLFLVILGISALTSPWLRAQQDTTNVRDTTHPREHHGMLIGPIGGYERVTYNTDAFPVLIEDPTSFIAQNGSGNGFYLGLSTERNFLIPRHLYYILEFEYDSKPANFEGNLTKGDTTIVLGTKLSYYLIDAGFKYDFVSDSLPRGFGIQCCVSIGLKNSAIFLPAGTSETVRHELEMGLGTITEAQALRIALRPELTYDWPLSKYWVLTPSAGYDFPFTEVEQTIKWRAGAFYAGVAVRYAVW